MVPAWSLALAFAAGLAVGIVACRLVMGRARPAEPEAPAAVTASGPAAPEPVAEAVTAPPEAVEEPAAVAVPEPAAPEPVGEAGAEPDPGVSAEEDGESEDPAAAVDDVVAELERRVKGRRTDGETDRTTGGRGRRG